MLTSTCVKSPRFQFLLTDIALIKIKKRLPEDNIGFIENFASPVKRFTGIYLSVPLFSFPILPCGEEEVDCYYLPTAFLYETAPLQTDCIFAVLFEIRKYYIFLRTEKGKKYKYYLK